jgi:hypothetical protein
MAKARMLRWVHDDTRPGESIGCAVASAALEVARNAGGP